MNTQTKVILAALRCLLRVSAMDCVKNPDTELIKAKINYIESSAKMIDELLALDTLIEEEA